MPRRRASQLVSPLAGQPAWKCWIDSQPRGPNARWCTSWLISLPVRGGVFATGSWSPVVGVSGELVKRRRPSENASEQQSEIPFRWSRRSPSENLHQAQVGAPSLIADAPKASGAQIVSRAESQARRSPNSIFFATGPHDVRATVIGGVDLLQCSRLASYEGRLGGSAGAEWLREAKKNEDRE